LRLREQRGPHRCPDAKSSTESRVGQREGTTSRTHRSEGSYQWTENRSVGALAESEEHGRES